MCKTCGGGWFDGIYVCVLRWSNKLLWLCVHFLVAKWGKVAELSVEYFYFLSKVAG